MHTARQNHKTFGDKFFFRIFEEGILNLFFFDKTHGKTTTTMPLSCSDPDSVDGETSRFGTASNLQEFLKRKLTDKEVYCPFIKAYQYMVT